MRNTQKCLMIKTKDNRKFFINESEYDNIIEFSKAIDAEISIVKVQEPTILTIEELVPAICNVNKKAINKIESYQIIKVKFPDSNNIDDNKEHQNRQIQEFIIEELLIGKNLSLKDIKKRFPEINKSYLCMQYKLIRNKLIKEGYTITKIGKGQYQVV